MRLQIIPLLLVLSLGCSSRPANPPSAPAPGTPARTAAPEPTNPLVVAGRLTALTQTGYSMAKAFAAIEIDVEAVATKADPTAKLHLALSNLRRLRDQLAPLEVALSSAPAPGPKPSYSAPEYDPPTLPKYERLSGAEARLVGREALALFAGVRREGEAEHRKELREYKSEYRESVAKAKSEHRQELAAWKKVKRDLAKWPAKKAALMKQYKPLASEFLKLRDELVKGLAAGRPLPSAAPTAVLAQVAETPKPPPPPSPRPQESPPERTREERPLRIPKGTRDECAKRADKWYEGCLVSCDDPRNRIPGCPDCAAGCKNTCRIMQGVEERSCNGDG